MSLFCVFVVRCWLVFVALSFLPIIFQGRSLHIFTGCPSFDSSLPLFIMPLRMFVFVFLKMKGFWVFCLNIKKRTGFPKEIFNKNLKLFMTTRTFNICTKDLFKQLPSKVFSGFGMQLSLG